MTKYDLIIIGCGPAGFAGAMRAIDLGKKVCIVERDQIGGAGIFWGALASKCLWELSKDFNIADRIDRGYRASGLHVDFKEVRKTVWNASKEKQNQMLSQIESYRPENGRIGSIELKRGLAHFIDKSTIEIQRKDHEPYQLQAEKFLLATGSRPRPFPGIPFNHKNIVSSDSILSLKEFPQRILIVGAGIIGCEYATIFSNFKQSEVFLVDRAKRILPFEDRDISGFIGKNLTENGVHVFHEAGLREARELSETGELEVVLDFDQGHSKVLEVDVVLICIGRIPNTDKLALEKIGVHPNSRGLLEGEHNCQVTSNLYAAGDITPGAALVNIGEMEGRFSIKTMYDIPREPFSYSNKSTIMFFKPEVAAVGLNERQCREKGIAYKVAFYSNALVNRAISMRSNKGFVKILVDTDGLILGMRAAGPQASSLVMCISLLMDQKQNIEDIIKTTHPHPSMTEGIQECIRLLLDKSIYKPDVFPEYMHVRTWAPED
jgi:dihydrolipoamide dehydrogenase